MSADYWKLFWLSHAERNKNSEPQMQVLRTLNQQPISQEFFSSIVDSVVTMLEPEQGNNLLDLCCGNGLLTRELINEFCAVTAIDLSEEFISQVDRGMDDKVTAFAADARTVELQEKSFDRILLYAGIQYFSDSEAINLLMRLRRWIRDEGLIVLGDIPDATRKWKFFNSPKRESTYFDALRSGKPIVGNWFEPVWLEKLSYYSGFSSAVIRPQPQTHPYQHYRFDLVLSA
jgi:cyclopropane fatty-acyl-phospholipid synthase-like methyltransferase